MNQKVLHTRTGVPDSVLRHLLQTSRLLLLQAGAALSGTSVVPYGQLRVYNAGGGGTITDNFSGATGSSTGIISNLNTTFFTNGITGSQAPVQIGGGAFFTPAGSGTGSTGFDSSLAPESTPIYFLLRGRIRGNSPQ